MNNFDCFKQNLVVALKEKFNEYLLDGELRPNKKYEERFQNILHVKIMDIEYVGVVIYSTDLYGWGFYGDMPGNFLTLNGWIDLPKYSLIESFEVYAARLGMKI